ncbi:hypothetical protein EXIGLDRAFT_729406 [Exidia glandulosa HHB12029]|uniref:Uncharacterized protein n=1 Tax=Exidia glandulosa HHB12029 TaxID=1314781 RepID=A0A165CKY3_EXIGL|nr:hypothetical protein EXIGLDRAFT_729406 [Exidia glandulosa HHB12029]
MPARIMHSVRHTLRWQNDQHSWTMDALSEATTLRRTVTLAAHRVHASNDSATTL